MRWTQIVRQKSLTIWVHLIFSSSFDVLISFHRTQQLTHLALHLCGIFRRNLFLLLCFYLIFLLIYIFHRLTYYHTPSSLLFSFVLRFRYFKNTIILHHGQYFLLIFLYFRMSFLPIFQLVYLFFLFVVFFSTKLRKILQKLLLIKFVKF